MAVSVYYPDPEKTSFLHFEPSDWVKQYWGYLNSYAGSRIGDREEARDLVQETFLCALKSRKKFERRSAEKTWLVAILRNKIIDSYRKKQMEQVSLAEWVNLFQAMETSPVANDIIPHLDHAIRKLPALWQKVFLMKNIEDRPTSEICRELAISDTNVWVILHRARRKLREGLKRDFLISA